MVLLYGNNRGGHFRQNSDMSIAIGLNNNYRNIGILSKVPTSDITIQKHHTVLPCSKIDDSAMTLTLTPVAVRPSLPSDGRNRWDRTKGLG